MILEEYCSYILSRERDLPEFTVPGSSIRIDKSDMLTTMRGYLRDNGGFDYDSLLLDTLKYYTSKDQMLKGHKFDDNMAAVMNNIRARLDHVSDIYDGTDRPLPFSYERVFEILVYYLRFKTNVLRSDKEKTVHYVTAGISPEAVIRILNPKLSMDSLGEEWEKNRWKTLYSEVRPLSLGKIDIYFKYVVLATYIRYCEIRNS